MPIFGDFWSVSFRIWTEYLSVFSPNARRYGPGKLQTRAEVLSVIHESSSLVVMEVICFGK